MQIRYDDSKADRSKIVRQIVFWSPLRVFGLTILSLSLYYCAAGHDSFMLMWFGYESENTYEEKINKSPAVVAAPNMILEKAFNSPVRDLELSNVGQRNFGNLLKQD